MEFTPPDWVKLTDYYTFSLPEKIQNVQLGARHACINYQNNVEYCIVAVVLLGNVIAK